MVNYRATASAAVLALLVTLFAAVPVGAAATAPAVRLSGELVQVADQQGAGFAAIRLADGALVPITAESVKEVASGSSITLDVAIPAGVRVAATENRTLTTQGVDGKQIAVPLRSSDLATAGDGSPEGLTSAIGKATVAEAMAPGTPALEVSKVVAAGADPVSTFTPATRQVYVAVVTPAGGSPRQTVDESRIRTQVADASSYWSEVTGGDLDLNVATITTQYTSAYDCSDPWGMWNEAAARVGFTSGLPPNTSVVIELAPHTPQNPYCGYGLGTVGTGPNSSGSLYVADDVWPVLAHELGHNMSMQHANALLCPTAADSAYSMTTSAWTGTGCREDPYGYGDGQDVMAASPQDFAPFLSAPQSLRTGIIPPSAAPVFDTAGTQSVTLLPLAGRTGVRAAEVVNPYTGVTYYVEYRTPAGRDLKNVYGVKTGVRVLRYNPEDGTTLLLDPSPTGQSKDRDPTLPTGQTFTSYGGRVSITTVSADSANAVVSVVIASSLTVPGAPTAVTAAAGDSRAAVSWAAPTSNGGAPVTGYTVTAAPGGKTGTTTGATIASVTGLTNGTAYSFTVTATNTVGTSTASTASGAVTPAPGSTVDTMPVLISYSVTGSPATPGGTITMSYEVSDAAGSLQTVIFDYIDPLGEQRQISLAGTALAGTITKVIPATWPNGTYALNDITVVDPSGNQAQYIAGGAITKLPAGATGATSHTFSLNIANFTVADVPSAPSWVSVSGGNQTAHLVWGLANGNGLPVTGYTVTASPGGSIVTTAGATAATITGLANGTGYTFTVTATNGIGTSLPSTASIPVTPSPVAPSQPTGVAATAGDAAGLVSWTAPVSDGGSPITGCTITSSPGGKTAWVSSMASTGTVTGLSNGTAYTFTVSATNAVGTSAASAASAWVTPMAPMVGFTGMAPKRVLNTLNGTGAAKAKLGSGRTLTLTVPGLPAGTTAVAINVMVTNPTATSYLTVYPGGTGRPGASNLNFVAGQTIPNLVTVPLGPGNTITFSNMYGTVDVLADLVGYFKPGTGAGFTGKAPTRVLNTLNATGAPKAKLGAGRTLTLTVPGLPAGTTAVAINVMATNPTAKSYLTVYPDGTGRPGASNLNFVAGQTIPNLVLVPLGPGNTVTFSNMYGTVNVLADLVGYFKPGTGAGFTGQTPTRVLNTLSGTGAPRAKLGAGRTLTLTVPGLPAGTTAVAINVMATKPTATSYLTVYPGGTGRPGASNLNFVAGHTIPNLVMVPLGPGNTITFSNMYGTVDVLADLVGYYK